MISFKKIWAVSRFEIKTLLRSWFFRIFAGISIVFLTFFDIAWMANISDIPWSWRAISSSVPYANIMLLNIVQAIIAVFLASDFLKRDKKLDTTEVIYMRSMSNGDYVLGKTLGITVVFMLLNIIMLVIAFILNIICNDIPINYLAYLLYPFLISAPTLVFIFGLSFLFMSLIRNQAVTFILLLGYIGISLFFIGEKLNGIFDYIAFYFPFAYSDFIGFGNLGEILMQRGIYLFLGIGFIFLTILLLRRLPQSRAMTVFSISGSVIFIFIALFLGLNFVKLNKGNKTIRTEMLALNNENVLTPSASITDCSIDLIHSGEKLEVTATIKLINNNSSPLDKYIFTLNPGLEIKSISSGGKDINYNKELHIITVTPSSILAPGSDDELAIKYEGVIDENVCYLDVSMKDLESSYTIAEGFFKVKKRFAIVNDDYVLLTPECAWYPVGGAGYSPEYPARHKTEFINFDINISTRNDLIAISQGKEIKGKDGKFEFKPEVPLTQLSLVIGKYEKRSLEVDSITYNLYLFEGHDYFNSYFTEAVDTIPILIRELKGDYERNLNLEYLYPRLSLVEVPVQFTSFRHLWTNSYETVQPEMVLLPEKCVSIRVGDFRNAIKNQERRMERSNQSITPKEMQARIFNDFVNNTFTRGNRSFQFRSRGREGRLIRILPKDSYLLYPNYYYYVNHLQSDKWPSFNLAMEGYITQGSGGSSDPRMQAMQGLSEIEKANLALDGTSFTEILNTLADDPVIFDVLKAKGEYIFSIFEANSGIEELKEFILEELEKNRYKTIDIDEFNTSVKTKFGFDIITFIEENYNSKVLPGIIVDDLKAYSIVVDNRTRHQVRFFISNHEASNGLVSVSFRLGGGGRGNMGGGRGGGGDMRSFMTGAASQEIETIILMEANQTKEIGIVLDEKPRSMSINTMISKNIPNNISFPFEKVELNPQAIAYEGERIIEDYKGTQSPDEIIVDNEDSGFEVHNTVTENFLKKLLNITPDEGEKYPAIFTWRPPVEWQATTNSNFYGKYIRSGHYVKSGAGENFVSWEANITKAGNYDIYTYINPMAGRMRMGRGRDGGNEKNNDQYHYKIYHDDGEEEAILEIGSAEAGWNFLGSFYLSPDKAKVELTNESTGSVVIADAIKWQKR
ncbi:hypothetical protein ACFLSI_01550 [Bacteroidota bacterium]